LEEYIINNNAVDLQRISHF